MRFNFLISILLAASVLLLFSCMREELKQEDFDVDKMLVYCKDKLTQTVRNYSEPERPPRMIRIDEQHWSGSSINSWTSGFYPGILWLMYDLTGEQVWRQNAIYFTETLEPIRRLPWKTHDFGFMVYYSFGLGYEIVHDEAYKSVLLETADSLATLFNPNVGTIESWPWMKRKRNWPHTTIIDNMMNLELLFWAAEHGGGAHLKDVAIQHAFKTREDFIRQDFSSFHVVVYDSLNSKIILRDTDQGFNQNSTWARGHSWGTYGFAKAYHYSGEEQFLATAIGMAEYYIEEVAEDHVPYWDFNAPLIPEEPKDASAAAIMASALLDLASFCEAENDQQRYYNAAMNILKTLSSGPYRSESNDAFLVGSVGSKPGDSEVGVSMIYTDYFYFEALVKAKKLSKQPVFADIL